MVGKKNDLDIELCQLIRKNKSHNMNHPLMSLLLLLLLLSHFSRVRLCATPWTAAYQASPSMGFSRQEHWSGLPFPSPGDLPNPRIEPSSPASSALAGRILTTAPPRKPIIDY